MIHSQKPSVRPSMYNHSMQEAAPTVGDIHSYLGKVLTINHYQVIVESILGQGGFAFVFLVRSFHQQRYALKRMYVNNRRDLLVCQREIALLKELSSQPNIVKYVDASIRRISPVNVVRSPLYSEQHDTKDDGEDDAIHEILLLTEYCTYGALMSRLHEQRKLGMNLNEQQILRIFADICRAVSACHFRRPQPILHRDIKLENIIIDSRQCYVLCDFGSAILLSPTTSKTSSEFQQYSTEQLTTHVIQQLEEDIQRYTTVAYRAPEMVDLYSRVPITLKADIWAMGCLLYKLMYNTMPFGESILAIQNGTFVIPDDLAHVRSRELNLFVRYMLEIDTTKRPDIWQVSYITFKLLGQECPIPNPCQSKIPDLTAVSLPLTDSQFRQQRTLSSTKVKSTSTNVINESSSIGTDVNPRERPRGMMASTVSLMNFTTATPATQLTSKTAQSPPSSAPSRSDSTAQLIFDDDFSQIPSHAISLTNISHPPSITDATSAGRTASRARPAPPGTLSGASGLSGQQQVLPPLPPPPSSLHPAHRRSASQTIPSTNTQPHFLSASSVDSARHPQHLVVADNHVSSTNSEILVALIGDENLSQTTSPEHQTVKPKGSIHRRTQSVHYHLPTEEANNSNKLNYRHEHTSNHANEQLNRPVEHDRSSNFSAASQPAILPTNSSSHDHNNPFFDAPFSYSSTHQQRLASTTILPPPGFRSSGNAIPISANHKSTTADSRNPVPLSRHDNIFADAPFISTVPSTKRDHPQSSIPPSSSAFTDVHRHDLSNSNTSSALLPRPVVGSSSRVKQLVHLPRANTMSINENNSNRVKTGFEPKQTAVYANANLSFTKAAVEEYF